MSSAWIDEQVSLLDEVWSRYWPFIEKLTGEQLDYQLPEGRTVKQVLAHIAFWEEAAVGFVRTVIRSEQIPAQEWYGGSDLELNEDGDWPAADIHNAREARWAAGQTNAAVLARLQKARAQLLALLRTVTPAEADGEVGEYFKVESRAGHFEEHLTDILSNLNP